MQISFLLYFYLSFFFFERKMRIIVQQYFVIFLSFKQPTLNNFIIRYLTAPALILKNTFLG